MKFEVKTDNENYSNSFLNVFRVASILGLIIIFSDFTLKLGTISRNYQIQYNCRLLAVSKSKSYFKKLSRLSNLKSKQVIWELCKEFIK